MIDELACDLDAVRILIAKLDPEDALNIDFGLFSQAFPRRIGAPDLSIIDESIKRLLQLDENAANLLGNASRAFAEFSQQLGASYLVTSLWNPIEKHRTSLAMSCRTPSGRLAPLCANLFYAITFAGRKTQNTSLTQFLSEFAQRKPMLATSFNGDASGIDICIPESINVDVRVLIHRMNLPKWFETWDDPEALALYRADAASRRAGNFDATLQIGMDALSVVASLFNRQKSSIRDLLDHGAIALSRVLGVPPESLSSEVLYTIWITQALWRKVVTAARTNYMYLVPEEYLQGRSVMTLGTMHKLSRVQALEFRAFAKEHLSSHLSHQLLYHIEQNVALANRAFTGHNMPRALGHLRRLYIPIIKTAIGSLSDTALANRIEESIHAIDQDLEHYGFLLGNALGTTRLDEMAASLYSEKIGLTELSSLANRIFSTLKDEVINPVMRDKIHLQIRSAEGSTPIYPKHLLFQIFTTLFTNALRHLPPQMAVQNNDFAIPLIIQESTSYLIIEVTNYSGHQAAAKIPVWQKRIDGIFSCTEYFALDRHVKRLLSNAVGDARDGNLGIGLVTLAAYLKAIEFPGGSRSGRGGLNIAYHEAQRSVTVIAKVPVGLDDFVAR